MEEQPSLFADDGGPNVLPGAGVINRNSSYHETRPKHTAQRQLVFRYIQKLDEVGATRHEIAEALGLPLSSVCGRVNELLTLGDVVETDQRRSKRTVVVAASVAKR